MEKLGPTSQRGIAELLRWDSFIQDVKKTHYRAKYGSDWGDRFMTREERAEDRRIIADMRGDILKIFNNSQLHNKFYRKAKMRIIPVKP